MLRRCGVHEANCSSGSIAGYAIASDDISRESRLNRSNAVKALDRDDTVDTVVSDVVIREFCMPLIKVDSEPAIICDVIRSVLDDRVRIGDVVIDTNIVLGKDAFSDRDCNCRIARIPIVNEEPPGVVRLRGPGAVCNVAHVPA